MHLSKVSWIYKEEWVIKNKNIINLNSDMIKD